MSSLASLSCSGSEAAHFGAAAEKPRLEEQAAGEALRPRKRRETSGEEPRPLHLREEGEERDREREALAEERRQRDEVAAAPLRATEAMAGVEEEEEREV